MDQKQRAALEHTSNVSFLVGAVDFFMAALCAISGSTYFVPFMLLAGIMWVCGSYFKRRAQEEIGE